MKMEKNNKVLSEEEHRKGILKMAQRFYGPEGVHHVQMHFNKYDGLIKNCGNESERKHLKLLAITELHTMLGIQSGLIINDQEVIPPKE